MQLTEQSSPRIEPLVVRHAPPWRFMAVLALTGLLAGAVYLYIVRGPMLLLDLASGMGGMFCVVKM